MNLLRCFAAVITALAICGSGCTKIDTPVREDLSETPADDRFQIVSDFTEILDTQPVLLRALGGSGTVFWSSPAGGFHPESGDVVLFIPHDFDKNETAQITADDEDANTAVLELKIIDEGPPPEPGDILINEVAWAGSVTSPYDEYIEIINRTKRPFYLLDWRIENGAGNPLTFSGKIDESSFFLIANYDSGSGKSAITCIVQYVSASLSLSNSALGPLILTDAAGRVFDTVGTGEKPPLGLNTSEIRASMSRYTDAIGTTWDENSWYTSGETLNLNDGSFGSPGAANSDTPFSAGVADEDALGIITEYSIDANDDLGEDWVEIHITRSGSLKNFVVTDLDGEDTSFTGGTDVQVKDGSMILVLWNDAYPPHYEDNRFYTADSNPTGTKDQLVLLIHGKFVDGVCYYSDDSTGDDRFGGDKNSMTSAGWVGDPVFGKHASRKKNTDGSYTTGLTADAWDPETEPSPGS